MKRQTAPMNTEKMRNVLGFDDKEYIGEINEPFQ